MALIQLSEHTYTIILWLSVTTLIFFVIKKWQLYASRRRFQQEHGCQPLYHHAPVWERFFGLDEMYRMFKAEKAGMYLQYARQLWQTHGKTHSKIFGGTNWIYTLEPENVKAVLSTRFEDFSLGIRTKAFERLLGKGIFVSDGEVWAHSRAMLKPNFKRDQVADLAMFERIVQDFLARIPKDGSTVDIQELVFSLTIDSATEFLFGRSVHTLRPASSDNPQDNVFVDAWETAQMACRKRTGLGVLMDLFPGVNADASDRICHAYANGFAEEALRHREDLEKHGASSDGSDDRYVFLYELAKQTGDRDQLRDELLNIMIAGRDTTAGLISNLLFILSTRPEIYAKLRREVEETLHGGLPDYDQLKSMKYLKYCMNESLRLHPPIPINSRLAIRDTWLPLGGARDGKSPLFVAKGTAVSWHTYSMHRLPQYYGPDADDFRPERWEKLKPGWEYLPFNGGPRICLGQQYALTEAGYVIVRLAQTFKTLEPRGDSEWKPKVILSLSTAGGVLVGCTPA